MEDLEQMMLRRISLLFLFARSALLFELSVTFSAPRLNLLVGETAEFTCNISNINISNYSIHWYKIGEDNQPKKLDNGSQNGRKYHTTDVDSQVFEMKVLDLKTNDSGIYYCGLISFSLNQTLIESMKRNLTVSEENSYLSEEEKTEVEPEEEEKKDQERKILLPALGVSGLLLVLACSCVLLVRIIRRKQKRGKSQIENLPLEDEPPSSVAVFTVDYGMLEFHAREATKEVPPPPLPKRCPLDQTEYATIVIAQEKPVPGDWDKRTKRPRVQLRARGHEQEAKR